jgi:hypothetical protein
MKTKFYLFTALTIVAASAVVFYKWQPLNKEVKSHWEENEEEQENRSASYIEARYRYEYDMLKDPVTGIIPEGIFEKERAFAKTLPVKSAFREMNQNTYIPAGPNNIGGRTRAVAYDRRFNGTTNRVILAGCVSGGVMRSTDGGTTWTRPTFDSGKYSHNLTALAQDPRPGFEDNWYAGTGEFIGNTASENGAPFLGYGIWKSSDNGVSWTKLTVNVSNLSGSTNDYTKFDHPFDFNYNIAVNPVNGDVYVGSWLILMKSTDGGNTFRGVFQSGTSANSLTGQMHVAISNTGRVYLAVNGGVNEVAKRGVWYSDTGEFGSWTRIAGGSNLGVDSVAGWRGNAYDGSSKRILITLAPSDNNIGYVYYENGLSSDAPSLKPEADFFRFDAAGTSFTWTNRSANMPDFAGSKSGSDPLTIQGGYDMEVMVKPDDPNTVFVGGTNLYRSTDGFASTANTAWIGGYRDITTYASYANSHADIHRLAFHPTDFSRAICANDGGIQETTSIMAAAVTWNMLPNYQTLQCYNVAIDPTAGRNNFASGSQDNGVRYRDKTGILGTAPADSNNHVLLFSADGTYVGISQENSGTQYLFESIQFGKLYRARLLPSFQSGVDVTPNGLTTSGSTDEFGEFVTNFRIETENTETIYYVNFNRLFRTNSASTVTKSTWEELTGVSSAVSPGGGTNVAIRGLGFSRGPYATSHALYIGTTNGKIFRLDDPKNASSATVPVNITPSGLTGNVQDIAVNPNNDDEVIAVVSNYNAVSIWWTKNGKSASPTWKNAEGNLTLPSYRSCAIVVKKDASNQPVTEYYVGTSIGLYSTVNLGTVLDAGQSPTWVREGDNLLNYAIVSSLAYRPVDNVLLVGTHGNGIFYTNIGTPNFTPNLNTGVTPVTNDKNFIQTVYFNSSNKNIFYQKGNLIGVGKISVELFNMKGQLIYREEKGYQNGSIPVQNLASGVYIVNIISNDNKYRHVQKIVKP